MGRDGNVMGRKSINSMFVEFQNVGCTSGCIEAVLLVFDDVENTILPTFFGSI